MIANAPTDDAASEMLWQLLIKPVLLSRIGDFRRDVRRAFLAANPSLGTKRAALYDQAFEVAAQDLLESFRAAHEKIVHLLAEEEEALVTWSRLLSGPDGPVLSQSVCKLVLALNDVTKETLQTAGISTHRTAVQACLAAQE